MILEPTVPAEVLAAIRAPFAETEATGVDAPVIQPLGLLLDLAGEAMRARLFVVQGEGGEEVCLRPDFTIPIARAHLAEGGGAGRYTYEGKAFRVAPRGSGRAEEFLQIGLEAYGGLGDPAEDAEVAALAWRASAAGGRDDLQLLMGDVALFSAFIDALGLADALAARLKRAFSHPRALHAELDRAQAPAPQPRQGDRLSSLLAGLPEAEACAVLEDLWAIAGIQPVGGRKPAEIVHRLAERAAAARAPRLSEAEVGLVQRYLTIAEAPRAALDRIAALAREGGLKLDGALGAWTDRLETLIALGAPEERMTLAAGFGRSFSYYDGFLFEVRSPALGEAAPVAAGGRYDGLALALGAAAGERAVGCMVRPARAWADVERAA
ncbi:MAG: ATP phosphoribosyltransferase regulatory subunit [Caulobacteraceae bacterium]|nr:ATP phosphoribosyltransferase regulatory subunit [Caulobacteraceae bacterium]